VTTLREECLQYTGGGHPIQEGVATIQSLQRSDHNAGGRDHDTGGVSHNTRRGSPFLYEWGCVAFHMERSSYGLRECCVASDLARTRCCVCIYIYIYINIHTESYSIMYIFVRTVLVLGSITSQGL